MKSFVTTCYGRLKWLPAGTCQVQTSNGAPEWWQTPNKTAELALAPESFRTRNKTAVPSNWRTLYRKQLERLHESGELQMILDRLPEGAAFLCYEADHNDCHRKILADFLNEKNLAKVSEVQPKKEEPKVEPQMSLL